jgi:hypothetical protein
LDSPLEEEEVLTKSESLDIISDNDQHTAETEKVLISKYSSSDGNKEYARSNTESEMRPINSQKYSAKISKTSDQNENKKEYMVNTESYDNREYSKKASLIVTENRKNKGFLVDAEIEVSNGNGVNRMAQRVGNYFDKKGLNVSRLTNAENFNFKETKIFYLRPYLHDAFIVAQQIPGWQNMKEVDELSRENIKIKVLIGEDLIPYHSLGENS